MHEGQRQRASEFFHLKGVERALFAHPHSVKWLTGFSAPLQAGQNLFAGGPSLVWYEAGHFTLIVLDVYASDMSSIGQMGDCTVVNYQGYTVERPIQSFDNLSSALQNVMGDAGFSMDKVGLEARSLPAHLKQTVDQIVSQDTEIIFIDDWLVPLRMIKSTEELHILRKNFALVDLGQGIARQNARPGSREIDVWTAVHSAIEQEVGCRVPMGNDCVVGYRQNNIGGWPLDYEIRPSDSLIVDLSTIHDGYWSDSCGTYFAGERTPTQIKLHGIVKDALDYAISLVKPGVMAKDIDQKVRQFIRDAGYEPYPHHTGHGVGVSGHEEPRIVPYNETVLQAGMVIMLEPGIYVPGETGVRLEDGLLVTADGAELLTTFDKT